MAADLLIDTGAFIALMDAGDDLHAPAAAFYRRLPAAIRQCTTHSIVGETYTFFRYHQGPLAALKWLDFLARARASGHRVVLYADVADDPRATELLRQFDDQPLSYTDALTLAALERHGIEAVFGFDHHLTLTGRPLVPGEQRARRPRH